MGGHAERREIVASVLLPAKHDSEGVSVGHGVDVVEGMRDRSSKKAATV